MRERNQQCRYMEVFNYYVDEAQDGLTIIKLFAYIDRVLSTVNIKDISKFQDQDLDGILRSRGSDLETFIDCLERTLEYFETHFPSDDPDYVSSGCKYLKRRAP